MSIEDANGKIWHTYKQKLFRWYIEQSINHLRISMI